MRYKSKIRLILFWSLLAAATLFLGAVPSAAADNEVLLTVSYVWPTIGNLKSPVWGDYDGDGDLDLAVAVAAEGSQGRIVYRNDGPSAPNGPLTQVWQSPTKAHGAAWGDYDGDGDLDLAFAGYLDTSVYRNDTQPGDATPAFTRVWQLTTRYTRSVDWGDYDGDGDLDLALGNAVTNGKSEIYRNDTQPGDTTATFTSVWVAPTAQDTWSIAWADFDGDGDLDLSLGNAGTAGEVNQIYRNDGGNVFTLAWQSDARITREIAWGDVDGDGDLDLAVGNRGPGTAPAYDYTDDIQVFRNDGPSFAPGSAWTFTLAWTSPEEVAATTIDWGDMDGDGDLDLVVGTTANSGNQSNLLYTNDGADAFSLAWESTQYATSGIALGDYDGDGDLDMFVGNYGYVNELYRNDGAAAALHPGWTTPMAYVATGAAWGDYDNDGNLDFALGGAGTERKSAIYHNEGYGSFSLASLFGGLYQVSSVAWGDMEGDGDLDLALGHGVEEACCVQKKFTVRRNDGDGSFTAIDVGMTVSRTMDVAWGEIDDDGRLELALVNYGDKDQVYRYKQDGTFALVWESPDSSKSRGVAWADYDGDGDLDLAIAAEERTQIWRNDGPVAGGGGTWTFTPLVWQAPGAWTLAWGDYDGDGDLDLVTGGRYVPNYVYRNDGPQGDGEWTFTQAWLSPDARSTRSLAWGDYDGDGDLDLAQGTNWQGVQIYRNQGDGTLTPINLTDTGNGQDVAWGDYDGDGDLDLLRAGGRGNVPDVSQIWVNSRLGGRSLPDNASSLVVYPPGGVANADFYASPVLDDRDVIPIPYTLFDPEGQSVGHVEASYSLNGGGKWSTAVAAGGTITPPLPTGQLVRGSQTYNPAQAIPDIGVVSVTLPISAPGTIAGLDLSLMISHTRESDLEIALLSPSGARVRLFDHHDLAGHWKFDEGSGAVAADSSAHANAGALISPTFTTTVPFNTGSNPYALSFDGLNDRVQIPNGSWLNPGQITVAAWARSNRANWNESGFLISKRDAYILSSTKDTRNAGFLVYVNGGWHSVGFTAPAGFAITDWHHYAGTYDGSTLALYVDGILRATSPIAGAIRTTDPGDLFLGQDDGLSRYLNGLLDDVRIYNHALPIADIAALAGGADISPPFLTHFDLTGLTDWNGESLNGDWRLVITDTLAGGTGSLVHWGLRIQTRPEPQIFYWDTFASGFFGQSDNVVLRLQAHSQPEEGGDAGLYTYTNDPSGSFQWSHVDAATFPFRVQGTQMRVISATLPVKGVEGAVVYRLPAGQARGGVPLADPSGQPYTTDAAGYLRGHGTVAISDTLVALAPITATDTYTLYFTNATPTATGLVAHTVISPGVQTITVTAEHPLLLFNLDVSLQWDARNDSIFLAPFEFNLRQTSDLLYDWTDGQAALGRVTVYHNRGRWNDAHLRVYASNSRRPSAIQGGIVGDVISDTDVISITYTAGQVHMGAVWNRYGEPGNNLGQDWPRTLAHELGHYAFFLDDNYLGFDDDGQVIPIDTCTGVMADPYRQDYPYDEFHADDLAWQETCTQTLSHQVTGRPDWRTIETYYPWLDGSLDNPGPSGLPLEVTQLTYVGPLSPPTALEDPTFYLLEAGKRVQPGNGARAFLYQDNWALDLGRPTLDHVLARGARPGDQVCVYEPAARRLGCETVRATDEQLDMTTFPGWQPDIAISPANSVTLQIQVSNLPTDVLAMEARLYPLTAPASGALPLTATVGGFGGTFHLAEPAFEGYVRVLVTTPADGREMITDYAVGGNPVSMRGGRVSMRGGRVSMRGGRAPVMSADGQVILFVDATSFGDDEFYTLQAVTAISPTLPWATVIGQAYRLSASEQAPDLAGASINFSYMADDVPVGGEPWLRLYYWDGLTWQQLPTTLDVYYNSASAPVRGEGLYALMASVELPLYGPGWNLVSYPLYFTQPVTQALLSLSVCDCFTTVYGYEATDIADPWKVYDVSVPGWVNDLKEMAYNHGYWINASTTVTWYLPVEAKTGLEAELGFPYLPATYYGWVVPGDGFTPMVGMTVTAWIDDHLCGKAPTLQVNGQVVYTVNVLAVSYAAPGCGTPGARVTFRVGEQAMSGRVTWDNDRVSRFDLRLAADNHVYLPLIRK